MRTRRTGSRVIGFSIFPRSCFTDAVYQRQVDLLHLPPGELLGQVAVSGIVPRHQDHAAGVAVQAVDDARAQLAAYSGKRLEAASSAFTSVPGVAARPGVDHHSGGLVDGDHVLVLVEDLERDRPRARRAAGASSAGSTSTDSPPRSDVGGLHRLAVRPARARFESSPAAASGCRREVAPEGSGRAACPRRRLVP